MQYRSGSVSAGVVKTLEKLLCEQLPQNCGACFAVGYGSGVFSQKNDELEGDSAAASACTTSPIIPSSVSSSSIHPVVDCMIVTCDSNNKDNNNIYDKQDKTIRSWHAANMLLNPSHYGGIINGVFPRTPPSVLSSTVSPVSSIWNPFAPAASRVTSAARTIGSGIHFVAPFELEQGGDPEGERVRCKYGVIDFDDAVDDLINWRRLAFAGRMHKPTLDVSYCLQTDTEAGNSPNLDYDRLIDAQCSNMRSAFSTSLLLLPEEFSEFELFKTMTGISYCGDVRTIVGAEDPMKVDRIVTNSMVPLREMYNTQITEMLQMTSSNSEEAHFSRKGIIRDHDLWQQIPIEPLKECASLLSLRHGDICVKSKGRIVRALNDACGGQCSYGRSPTFLKEILRKSLYNIVFRSSLRMISHAALTTNVMKSIQYTLTKLLKGRMSASV